MTDDQKRMEEIENDLRNSYQWILFVWNPAEGTEDEEVIIHGGPDNKIVCRMEHVNEIDKRTAWVFARSNHNLQWLLSRIKSLEEENERLLLSVP